MLQLDPQVRSVSSLTNGFQWHLAVNSAKRRRINPLPLWNRPDSNSQVGARPGSLPVLKVNCAGDQELYGIQETEQLEISAVSYPQNLYRLSPYFIMLQLPWISELDHRTPLPLPLQLT